MALSTPSAIRLPDDDRPTSTAARIAQLNGNRTRGNSKGASREIVIAQSELIVVENRNEMRIVLSAARHGECRVRPLNATATVMTAIALIAVIRPQKRSEQISCILDYCRSLVGGSIGTSSRPGTFSVAGANRPPTAMPPGSGVYSSMAICDVAFFTSAVLSRAGVPLSVIE